MIKKIFSETNLKHPLLYLFFDNFKDAAEKTLNNEIIPDLKQLMDTHYDGITTKYEKENNEKVLQKLTEAKENYSKETESKITESNERGALRTIVWGKKTAASQVSLLKRFSNNPSIVEDGKKIFVCDACGFVMIKGDAPEICPVCKAPASRFIGY